MQGRTPVPDTSPFPWPITVQMSAAASINGLPRDMVALVLPPPPPAPPCLLPPLFPAGAAIEAADSNWSELNGLAPGAHEGRAQDVFRFLDDALSSK